MYSWVFQWKIGEKDHYFMNSHNVVLVFVYVWLFFLYSKFFLQVLIKNKLELVCCYIINPFVSQVYPGDLLIILIKFYIYNNIYNIYSLYKETISPFSVDLCDSSYILI